LLAAAERFADEPDGPALEAAVIDAKLAFEEFLKTTEVTTEWVALGNPPDWTPDDAVKMTAGKDRYEYCRGAAVYAACVAGRFFAPEWQAASAVHAGFLRDIFGNPFRPATLGPSWLTSTVVALARQIYESRDFST